MKIDPNTYDVSFKSKAGGLYCELFDNLSGAKEYYHEVITSDETLGAMLIRWGDDGTNETLKTFGDISK